ncbi:MAG: hypothetical protein KDA21_04745 [Phycisphaerales bacterium]|nr:hypothetical protein [Phycisphaerales bacterium]
MFANALVILLLLVFVGVWARRAKGYGAFSAFLAMICVLAAGSVAFAVWEPLAYGVFLKPGMEDYAWALALLLPFIVSLVIFRLLVDSVVKANVQLDDITSFAIAGVCSLVSGVVTTGIIVIGVSFMRLPPEILMWQPVESRRDGNLVYERPLWVPVDKITAKIYEQLSLGAFDVATPLATYQPDVYVQAGMVRMTHDGVCRVGIQPDDFSVLGHYIVSPAPGETSIFQDTSPTGDTIRAQTVLYYDGSEAGNGSVLHGYLMQFKSTAREKGGSIIMTPGQLSLICQRDDDGTSVGIHPFAVVATPSGTSSAIKRFRFDFTDAVISSVGGGQTAEFGFEFAVPPGYQPLHLLVRNVRVDLQDLDRQWAADAQNPDGPQRLRTFATVEARDEAVRDRTLFTAAGLGAGPIQDLDASEAQTAAVTGEGSEGVSVTPQFPGGYILNRTDKGGLEVNANNEVIDGKVRVTRAQLKTRPDRDLQVRMFASTNDTAIVRVEIAQSGRKSLYGRALDRAEKVTATPMLVDSNGNMYPALGYIHDDGTEVEIRFTPQDTIRNLDTLPPISAAATGDQAQWLIFRPTKGVYIKKFILGNRVVVEFEGDGIKI